MPADRIHLTTAEDDAHWLGAAAASGQTVPVFHHPRFLRAAARVTGRSFRPLVVRHRGTDVGVATWLEKRKGPVATVNQVPFPYAGPLVPPELLAPTLQALRSRGARTGVAVQTHQLAPTTHVDEQSLDHEAVARDDTYVVDTARPLDVIEQGIHSQCRRQIRKARRLGVELDPDATDLDSEGALDRALASVFERHGSTLGYRSPLGLTRSDLEGDGLRVRLTVARLEGEAIGALLSLAYGSTGIQWMAGVRQEFRHTAANSLLYWDALAWSHETGVARFDLLGNPTPAITNFKKQFGGDLVSYPTLTHHSWWARGALTARQALSDLPRRRD